MSSHTLSTDPPTIKRGFRVMIPILLMGFSCGVFLLVYINGTTWDDNSFADTVTKMATKTATTQTEINPNIMLGINNNSDSTYVNANRSKTYIRVNDTTNAIAATFNKSSSNNNTLEECVFSDSIKQKRSNTNNVSNANAENMNNTKNSSSLEGGVDDSNLTELSPCANKTFVSKESIPYIRDPSTVFLHMGKNGGGSISERVRDWKLAIQGEHPSPKKKYNTRAKKFKSVWINLRDPVDRFVSAFYWRLVVICDPDGDTRSTKGNAPEEPQQFCKYASKEETQLLFYEYRRDANLLAEALCSQNETVSSQAKKGIKKIEHIRNGITDWIGKDYLNMYSTNLFPMVQEHTFDIIMQVDDAVRWTRNVTKFEDEAMFSQRQDFILQDTTTMENCHHHKQPSNIKRRAERLGGGKKHSSSAIKKSLSKAGEACVTKFYVSEYDNLKQIRQSLCRTDTCRDAIGSILKRRQERLQYNVEDTMN